MGNQTVVPALEKTKPAVQFDEIPLNRFHFRVTALTFGAHFNDGFEVGIIGMALVLINRDGSMPLTAWWDGALGAGALLGLFLGAITFGSIADRVGRQKIFTLSFAVIALATLSQFWVEEPWQLLILRVILGLGIGGDYSVGHAMLAEILPKKHRGEILGSFSVVWTFGYVFATMLGIWIMSLNAPGAWRWMLITPGIFAVIILIARLGIPESPRWLMRQGKREDARKVLDRYFGSEVVLEEQENSIEDPKRNGFAVLFSPRYRKLTIFNCVFFTSLVMPYFAIYTFLPTVLDNMGLAGLASGGNGYAVEIYLNVFLLVGAVAGIYFTAKFSRRGFLITSFVVLIISLLVLAFSPTTGGFMSVACFAVFTFTLSAASNLVGVFPAESYPTAMRSSGIGFATAVSCLGSVVSTFLLPVMLESWGTGPAMLFLAVVLTVGMTVSILWAPEAKHKSLVEE